MIHGDASLRQAPRFHAFFGHIEARQVLLMSRRDWERLAQLGEGEIVEIDISTTPIARVAEDSRVEAVVAARQSDYEVVLEVFRNDPQDAPTPVNVDRYGVWERLPPHRNYVEMVNSASTEDNANMRRFLEDHVFLVKDEVTDGHRLPELPLHVRAVLRRRRA